MKLQIKRNLVMYPFPALRQDQIDEAKFYGLRCEDKWYAITWLSGTEDNLRCFAWDFLHHKIDPEEFRPVGQFPGDKVEASNYGGAYDVDPEQYFTRNDLNELSEAIVNKLNSTAGSTFDVESSYVEDDGRISVAVYDNINDLSFESYQKIDMRKIRKPSDLVDKYTDQFVADLRKQIDEYDELYWTSSQSTIVSSYEFNSDESRIIEIKEAVNQAMHSALYDMGFEEDDIRDYFYIDGEQLEDGSIKIEVRGELSYEGMDELANALNGVVQYYDPDAYFDHEDSGIINAVISESKGKR